MKRNILLNPGPATTTDSVKKALVVPDICPREKEFQLVMKEVRRDLTRIAGGSKKDFTTILFTGSGTAAMDACVNSVVPKGKKIAIVNNGAYGERMVKIARAYKIPVAEIKGDWDKPIRPDEIEKVLRKDKKIAVLALVHHETTTGLESPLREAGEVAKNHGCVYVVDAISSYAGKLINMERERIDFLMSTSNKCIQGMAGIAFVVCRKKELRKLKDYPVRSYYLNLYQQYEYFEKTGQMQFTPPVQVVYALKQAIKELRKEGGVRGRSKRYARSYKTLYKGLEEMGFELLLDPKKEAGILITIKEPKDKNFRFEKMHDELYARGFTIYPGKLGDKKTFRLSVLGAVNEKDIARFLVVLKNVLAKMKVVL